MKKVKRRKVNARPKMTRIKKAYTRKLKHKKRAWADWS